MTKLRPPLSFEDAIVRIADRLGWDAAAAVLGIKDRQLRNFSDPEHIARISAEQALRLDVAYRVAGGEGAPCFEAFALQLEASNRVGATGAELARRTARAAKEGGEALAALIAAATPGATPADRALAVREVREGIDALKSTLPVLEEAEEPAGGSG